MLTELEITEKMEQHRDLILGILAEEQADICPEYLAYREDEEPGILVTFAVDDDPEYLAYQTGDTSFSGGCYQYSHWASVAVYADSDLHSLADDVVETLIDEVVCALEEIDEIDN